jgi:hypothetical protein
MITEGTGLVFRQGGRGFAPLFTSLAIKPISQKTYLLHIKMWTAYAVCTKSKNVVSSYLTYYEKRRKMFTGEKTQRNFCLSGR